MEKVPELFIFYCMDDEGVNLIRCLIDGYDWIDGNSGFILFVSFLDDVVLKAIDRDDKVIRKF